MRLWNREDTLLGLRCCRVLGLEVEAEGFGSLTVGLARFSGAALAFLSASSALALLASAASLRALASSRATRAAATVGDSGAALLSRD